MLLFTRSLLNTQYYTLYCAGSYDIVLSLMYDTGDPEAISEDLEAEVRNTQRYVQVSLANVSQTLKPFAIHNTILHTYASKKYGIFQHRAVRVSEITNPTVVRRKTSVTMTLF